MKTTFAELLLNFFGNTTNIFATFLRIIFFANWFPKIKNIHPANDCLILGNGPSLNGLIENQKSFIENKSLFCVNFFPTTPYYEELKPAFHIISAPDLWRNNVKESYIEHSKKLYSDIANKTQWGLTLFIPYEARKFKRWKEDIIKNKNITIKYYNITPVEGPRWFRHFFFRKQFGMPRTHNVLIPSLMLSINLGFKNIYLWGADHSWLSEISVDSNNLVLVNQKHFYDESTSKPEPMNKIKEIKKLHEILLKFAYSFQSYFVIKEYAKQVNINIINATPNSFIDAFDRYKMP
ncbi:MAG: hypothetical protein HY951_08190 [Bacteroidia bacterium]|nr:hypothetical protein [Bacteroidia bacterium]